MSRVTWRPLAVLPAALLLLSCGAEQQGTNLDPDQVDSVEAPDLGACRVLAPEDLAQPSNATQTVACSEPHTAQTFAVASLPAEFDDADHDDPTIGSFVYGECDERFREFVGGDESLVMRAVVTWAWFRPSAEAWSEGARWYRCDVVGGGEMSESFVDLPTEAKGLLQGKLDDQWLVCADGATLATSARVPCSEEHNWRAVTTIKLGEPEDDYPGDRAAQARTRDFCDKSVAAVLGYPVKYDFAYTWFREAEWEAGNRRSVCWARTDE